MENELKESEEKFRSLAETTTNGIIILQEGHIVYHNPAVETYHRLQDRGPIRQEHGLDGCLGI